MSELPSVIQKHNNTIHNSIKTTPIQTTSIVNEKLAPNNFKDKKEVQKPNFELGQLVRTPDNKIFSKSDSTNYSYKHYTITQIKHDTIPSYRIDYLTKRYNENLLLPTKLTLDENNQLIKELNLIQ